MVGTAEHGSFDGWRRRRTVWAALAGVAAVVAAIALVDRPSDEPVRVFAGPDTTVQATIPGVTITAPPADATSTPRAVPCPSSSSAEMSGGMQAGGR